MTVPYHEVVICWDDGSKEILEVSEDETVLEAAHRTETELPYACQWGACARCIARLLDGEFIYAQRPGVLEKFGYGAYPHIHNERGRRQYVLLCIARPQTSCRVRIEPRLYEELTAD